MKSHLGATLMSPVVSWIAGAMLPATGLFCFILTASNVASAASVNLPTIDITTTCRESDRALSSIFGPNAQQTFDNCMKQEKEARDTIIKSWSNFPAGGRQRCVNVRGYMPSYVEWLTCLEMEQSVYDLRKNQRATTRPATTEGRAER